MALATCRINDTWCNFVSSNPETDSQEKYALCNTDGALPLTERCGAFALLAISLKEQAAAHELQAGGEA